MIRSIKVHNYKNLSGLHIPAFANVNLISGKNNVGKSSLLEVLGLLITDSVLPFILELRGEKLVQGFGREDKSRNDIIKQNTEILSSLFTGRNNTVTKENCIEITDNNSSLALRFVYYVEQADEDGYIKRIITDETKNDLSAENQLVALQITRNDESRYLIPLDKRMELMRMGRYNRLDTKRIILVDANNSNYIQSNPVLWDRITLTNKERFVIQALQIIDPSIENLAFLESNNTRERYAVVKTANSDFRIPLKSMGDGINHILSIILALVNCEDGCLLIDEIDNGLHYSVQKQLWSIIFELSGLLNIQVFATTHSSDCISSFGKAMSIDSNSEKGRYYRLEYKNNGIQAIEYNAKELTIVAAQNIEVR